MSTLSDQHIAALVRIARQQGQIGVEEIARVFPLAEMSPSAVAALVLRLEEVGIEVDLDPALFREKPRSASEHVPDLTLPAGQRRPIQEVVGQTTSVAPDHQLATPRREGSMIQVVIAVLLLFATIAGVIAFLIFY